MPSHTSPALPVSAVSAVRGARPELRRQVLAVRRWALARGLHCEADAVTVVAGVCLGQPAEWSEQRVEQFLWVDVLHWCRTQGLAVPRGVPRALWLWLEHGTELGQIEPGPSGLAGLVGIIASNTTAPAIRPRRPTRGRSASVSSVRVPAV